MISLTIESINNPSQLCFMRESLLHAFWRILDHSSVRNSFIKATLRDLSNGNNLFIDMTLHLNRIKFQILIEPLQNLKPHVFLPLSCKPLWGALKR